MPVLVQLLAHVFGYSAPALAHAPVATGCAPPEVGFEHPTAQALVHNLRPLKHVLAQAHANMLTAQRRQMTQDQLQAA